MKSIFIVPIALSGFALADDAVPVGFERDRYEATFAVSPFALETLTPPPRPPKDDPLKDLTVTGLGKLDDGRDFVLVQRGGDPQSMRFESREPNRHGFAVKQVNWADRWKESTVVITRDGRERTIEFNKAAAIPKSKPEPPRPPKPGPKVTPRIPRRTQ